MNPRLAQTPIRCAWKKSGQYLGGLNNPAKTIAGINILKGLSRLTWENLQYGIQEHLRPKPQEKLSILKHDLACYRGPWRQYLCWATLVGIVKGTQACVPELAYLVPPLTGLVRALGKTFLKNKSNRWKKITWDISWAMTAFFISSMVHWNVWAVC